MLKKISFLFIAMAMFFAGKVISAPLTQYLKLQVVYNSNMLVQQPFELVYAFSQNGLDGLDANDVGNQNSLQLICDHALPFSMSNTNDVIAFTDARPVLDSYKKMQMGFQTKNAAFIRIIAMSSGNMVDSTGRPVYAWLECISTGQMYSLMNDTVDLNIPANENFTADYYIHTGPRLPITLEDETCYNAYDGSISITNPGTFNWHLNVYKNSVLISSHTVYQPDTTIMNLSAGTYTLTSFINSIPVDSSLHYVDGYPQILPSFTADNYYPATNDVVIFTNTSVNGDTYNWDFGDSITDANDNTFHQYQYIGHYLVTLTAMNEIGCTEIITDSIFVSQGPIVLQPGPHIFSNLTNQYSQAGPTSVLSSFNANATASPLALRVLIEQNAGQQMTVNILNQSGQLISSTQCSDSQLELSVPAPGVYVINMISSTGEIISKKVITSQL